MKWNSSAGEMTRANGGFGYMMIQSERLIEDKHRSPCDGTLLVAMIKATD